MKGKFTFLIPLSAMILAGCGNITPPGGSSVPGPAASSDAPTVSTHEGGDSGTDVSGDVSGDASATDDSEGGSVDPSETFAGIVRVYFHNDTGTERNKRIYVWCDGVDGIEHDWTGYKDGVGAYYDIDIREAPYAGYITDYVAFIIKSPGTWSGQSADVKIKFADYANYVTTTDAGDPLINVYSCFGEGNAVDAYPEEADVLGDYIQSFAATTDWNGLQVVGSGAIKEYTLFCIDDKYLLMNEYDKAEHYNDTILGTGAPNSADFTIRIDGGVDPQKTYRIEAKFVSNPSRSKKKVATFDRLFDTEGFQRYTYTGNDLGVTYTKEATSFRVWAPTTTLVRVNVYNRGTPAAYTDDPVKYAFYDQPLYYAYLEKQAGGVWAGTMNRDLKNKYYTFTLFYNDGEVDTVDPYAKACGINGIRGCILDMSTTNPEGWDNLSWKTSIVKTEGGRKVAHPNMLTPYEVHIRDFTADETWVSTDTENPTPRGTFKAFAEPGTSYNGVATGFDHLKELGVNAVQILPAFDQSNDERTLTRVINGETVVTKPAYNWGYNPQNYNCVEGSYSTDPFDAATRIKEYKQMILDLSKADIRVIMDVVYNHVASVTSSPFQLTCPRYFFRYDENMNLIDDSGVGNAVHTDRPMARKFIVDSCRYWAEEYKIGGYRFDLMGCIDVTTMRQAKDAVYDVNPEVVMYGEGWCGDPNGNSHASVPAKSYETYKHLGDNGKGSIGCFNDAGRDGAKGNDGGDKAPLVEDNEGRKLWLTKTSTIENVYNTLTMVLGQNRWAEREDWDPNQTVNYLACHDNYTLYDQINYQFNYYGAKMFDDPFNEWAMKACVGISGVSLFGQGIGFIHGGDEFFRQKVMMPDDPNLKAMQESYHLGSYTHPDGHTDTWQEGDGVPINEDSTAWLVRNSYKYGDAVNSFKWDRLSNEMVATYYAKFKELVHTRISEMGNTLGQDKAAIKRDDTWCWNYKDLFNEDGSTKTSVIAAGFIGQTDGKGVYMLANKGVENAGIGIGNGDFEVLYSSTGDHSGNFSIGDNWIGVGQYECLIIRRLSGGIK